MSRRSKAPWSVGDIADAVEAGLAAEAERRDREQSVLGLDALDELSLHPILAGGLRRAGYGVFAEQRYPTPAPPRKDREAERCDLVLTPDARPLAAPGREPTLFDPPDAVGLDDAFWLEVKVVSQFTPQGPNQHYSSQLLSTVRLDVTKLSKEPGILHAGLVIVLFTESRRVAEHDLGVWLDRCLKRGLPVGSPSLRTMAIVDRLGNGFCAIALYPVHHY